MHPLTHFFLLFWLFDRYVDDGYVDPEVRETRQMCVYVFKRSPALI